MRFGSVDVEQSWKDRLERELMVRDGDFELVTASTDEGADRRVQFGAGSIDRGIRFDVDGGR